MTKILIIGCTGMVGYNLFHYLKETNNDKYTIYGTCKSNYNLKCANIYEFHHNKENLEKFINNIKPDIVINCIALLSETTNDDKINMIYSNITLPIELNQICREKNIYLIHFSSDAVFKSIEAYNDINNEYSPQSFYAMTKVMSECIKNDSLILRICPIGFDKFKNKSLFNYIYSNNELNINGYKKCYFNGLTTIEIAKEIVKIIEKERIYGIRHLTGPKISKFELLNTINIVFDLKKNIIENNNIEVSRLLKDDLNDPALLNWDTMIRELKYSIVENNNLFD